MPDQDCRLVEQAVSELAEDQVAPAPAATRPTGATRSTCEYHEGADADFQCSLCRTPLCGGCLSGDDPRTPMCPDCAKGAALARGACGTDTILTALLFFLSFPVAAPGLVFLFISAKRWGALAVTDWLFAQVVGATACTVLLKHYLEYSWELSLGLVFASAAAGLAFFVRELAARRT